MVTPVTMYGRATCEDTALVRERLRVLDIPFIDIDIETDDGARTAVERLNEGHVVTPTLIVGREEFVLAEPTLDELQETLARAGLAFDPPLSHEMRGPKGERPLPDVILPAVHGGSFRASDLRGRSKSVWFFAHNQACLPCAGYAKELRGLAPALAETQAVLVTVLQGSLLQATAWSDEFMPDNTVLADGDGAAKGLLSRYYDLAGSGVLLLLLDRYTAPRLVMGAANAGGLLTAGQIAEWLIYLDYECAE